MDIRAKLIAAFRIEYKEHLEFIRSALNKAESGEDDCIAGNIDDIFRHAHSLKGAARAADLRPVENMANGMETLFAHIRSGKMQADASASKAVLDLSDAIEDWMAAFLKGETPKDGALALLAIDQLIAGRSPKEAKAKQPVASAGVAAAKQERIKPKAKESKTGENQADGKAASPAKGEDARAEDIIRVSAANLDRLLRSAGQLMTENVSQDIVGGKLRSMENILDDIKRIWNMTGGAASPVSKEGGSTARRLNALDDRIRLLAKEFQAARRMHHKSSWMLRQLCGEMQNEIRLARMTPAENIFGGFRKMIRDLARDEHKEAEARVIGLEVQADRLVLQALKDPLMHMIRNAVHHGVETPKERAGNGKNESGCITLAFKAEGGRLAVEVDDDGRGLDLKKIAKMAVREGRLTKEEAKAAPARELQDIIFKPGFSTLDEASDMAGRGMGMSVVQDAVARLNGAIEIVNKDGPGTKFRLMLPLSISSHRLLLVASQGNTFAIPASAIERLCLINVKDVKTVEGAPFIDFQGRRIPLRTLSSMLGLDAALISSEAGTMPALIINAGHTKAAIAVDALLAIRDAVVKDLGFPLPKGSKAAGGILLEDGSVSIVLSPFALGEAFRRRCASLQLEIKKRAPEKKPPVILVVDDSITTRTLEKNILEAHGYRVLVAVDGVDALAKLHSETIDLVVSDIMMPRLDGFGLLAAMKNDRDIANVPVIIVTSLENAEDQERGLSLGAGAYVVKQKFDQQGLLDAIGQIL